MLYINFCLVYYNYVSFVLSYFCLRCIVSLRQEIYVHSIDESIPLRFRLQACVLGQVGTGECWDP